MTKREHAKIMARMAEVSSDQFKGSAEYKAGYISALKWLLNQAC